jgi:phage terminase large subunit-like protein
VPYERIFEVYDTLREAFSSAGKDADFLRNMCLADRFFLLLYVLDCPPANHPWIYERMREVQKNPDDHLDLWPRSHFKSTSITFAGTVQEILRDQDIAICIFSHSKGLSKNFLDQIKQVFEGNVLLKSLFPDILYENPKRDAPRWSVDKGITVKRTAGKNPKKEPTLMASGVVDGQPTGAHFDLRVYDDLVTAESVSTPEQVEKTTNMLALSQNLGNTTGLSRAWYIGTRYSFGDTYQDMIDKGSVKVRKYAATDDGTLDGNPVFMTPAQWEAWKLPQTTASLNCQMMQNPLASNSSMFDVSRLAQYEIRPALMNVYIICDPASSMKKGSDKTAMVAIGVDVQGRKFLLDGFHHKMALTETWKLFKFLHDKWSNKNGVVDVFCGYEKYSMQRDIEHFQTCMEREGYYFPIEELNTPKVGGGSKIDRMSRLEPDIRSGKLMLPLLVSKDGKDYIWRVKPNATPDEDILEFKPQKSKNGEIRLTEIMKKYPELAVRPIKRKDEANRVYDLTLDFISQLKMVPFAKHDDLVDAISRIYDMEVQKPDPMSRRYQLPDYIE